MILSSFKFLWWALKNAYFKTECVTAIQGHPMSLIMAPGLLVINSNLGPILHCF